MSLIAGPYFRGDPQVKPQPWGNFADVQSALFHNAEKAGIDPAKLVFYMPMWENAGGVVHDYVQGAESTLSGTASFFNQGVYFNGGYLPISGVTYPTSTTWTFITNASGTQTDTLKYLFDSSTNRLIFAWTINVVKYIGWHDSTNWQGSSVSINDGVDRSLIYLLNGDDSTGKVYVDNIIKVSKAYVPTQISGTTAIGSKYDNSSNAWVGYMRQVLLSSQAFSSDQTALFMDQPYFLLQPTVNRSYFFITEDTGETILPTYVTDGFTFADSVTKTANLLASAVESVNMQDSDQNIATFISQLTDSFNLSDSTTALTKIIGLISDDINLSDASTVRADLAGSAAESIEFSESLIAALQARAVAAEIINLSDSVTATDMASISAAVAEAINFSDSSSVRADLAATLAETFNLSDGAVNILSALATAAEQVNISDSTFWQGIQYAIVSDGVSLSDSATSLVGIFANVADSVQLSDSGSVTATFNVTVVNVVQFAETVGTIAALRANIADGINITATAMEVSTLPNGKCTVSFTLTAPGVGFEMKQATIVFNIK